MTEKKSTKPADKKVQGEAPESGEAPFGAQVHVDLGFGGLFKGISNLLDLVGNLAEAGENMNRSGEFKVGDNEKMQGVYGFLDPAPDWAACRRLNPLATSVSRMPDQSSPIPANSIVDVFDEGRQDPRRGGAAGVAKKEIKVELNGDKVGVDDDRGYASMPRKCCCLPPPRKKR
ncbi:MAG: hypothetical protein U0X20_22245 [Caldilineaceae bacterium]